MGIEPLNCSKCLQASRALIDYMGGKQRHSDLCIMKLRQRCRAKYKTTKDIKRITNTQSQPPTAICSHQDRAYKYESDDEDCKNI